MKTKNFFFIILASLFLLFTCNKLEHEIEKAESFIDDSDMRRYVSVLASDDFQGRKPVTIGETKTIEYLKKEFKRIGLKSVNGSYFQDVPMVEIKGEIPDKVLIESETEKLKLSHIEDYLLSSRRITDASKLLNSEFIFAGYGIVASEYDWNDYKGLDVKGKTVLVLVNDPGYGTKDSTFFKGNAMTYYGRWTYKYEEAARQGAAGILVIHNTGPAGYPFSVLSAGAGGSELYNKPDDNYESRCMIEGWLTNNAFKKIIGLSGINYDELIRSAKNKDFKAVDLELNWSVSIKQEIKYDVSKNVIGIIEGSERPKECIVYSAHWDHFGIGPVINGDSIYNGAVDNGTSLAWMLEIAEAFTKLRNKPKRTVLFLAPTAEETGMLGSAYYVQHPYYDIDKTVACINNDLMLPLGKMKDVMVTGYGQSELDDYVKEVAELQGRYIFPDPNPQTGMYFRSDHFSFAKAGVPSLFVRGNCDHAEKGKEWAAEKEKDWLANYYHKPTDKYEPEIWNFEGIIEDAKLAFRIGLKLANEKSFPNWNEGSEFKEIREKNKSD